MKLLYEDAALIVCEKPAGLLSQSDAAGGDSAVARLSAHTAGTVYPVHRLDRATAELMVFAKTSDAAAALSRQISEHRFCKEYTAAVHGCPHPGEGSLEDWLFFDRRAGKSYAVKRQRAGVKKAVLHYRTLETRLSQGGEVSRLGITLETGRTHQIRVQFASRGMPLVGDRRYGARDGCAQLALCACRLAFRHPVSGEELCFIAEPSGPAWDFWV